MSEEKNAVCETCGGEGTRSYPYTSYCYPCRAWKTFITTNTRKKKKKAVEEPEKEAVVEDEEETPDIMIV